MYFATQRFAIECHVRNAKDRSCIGDLWLWANGLRIGDDISGVDLPLVLAALSGPLLINDHRHDVFFDSLSKEQVAEFFFKLVFLFFFRWRCISAHRLVSLALRVVVCSKCRSS